MLQFELLDETFDLNLTSSYHLSIQADLDGFLYAILNPGSEKYLGLKQYTFKDLQTGDDLYDQIQKVMREDPLLQNQYGSVSCMHPDSRSTLLPAALFDRDQLKSYFVFNHPLGDLEELQYNYLKHLDAYVIFPLYHEIANLYLESWVNTNFYHPVTALLEEVLGHGQGLSVSIHLYARHFDIIVSDGQKLRFNNSFTYRTEEDILYFILFVFDKLELDQENTPVFLSGFMDKLSERPSFFRRYFKKISFRNAPAEFQYPPVFDKIQEHFYLNVFKVYHCA
jgi:hypothetical protein